MNEYLLYPVGWLVAGLPWPSDATGPMAECAVAVAPTLIPRSIVSSGAGKMLDLAAAMARDPAESPGPAVFLSDATLVLDRQGRTWGDLKVDVEAVVDELAQAHTPQLFMTLSSTAHTVLCDATRSGIRIHYTDGDSQQITPRIRRDVHDAIAGQLAADWPPYIRSLIDRGLLGRR